MSLITEAIRTAVRPTIQVAPTWPQLMDFACLSELARHWRAHKLYSLAICLWVLAFSLLCRAGHYEAICNSALAEQRNSFLRRIESQVSYMKQTTFMWYMRFYLYKLNKRKELPIFR